MPNTAEEGEQTGRNGQLTKEEKRRLIREVLKEKLGIMQINDIVIGEKLNFLAQHESPTKRQAERHRLSSRNMRLMRMPSNNNSENMSDHEEDSNPANGGVFISPLKINTSFRTRDRGRIANPFINIGSHSTTGGNEEP